MTLRTKLVLAFVVMSVVPLTAVTLVSYRSSLAAFRETVESEADRLTGEMRERMEMVTADLDWRIDQLGELPYDEIRAASAADHEGPRRFLERFVETMGDRADYVQALEFLPAAGVRDGPDDDPALHEQEQRFVIEFTALWNEKAEQWSETGQELAAAGEELAKAGEEIAQAALEASAHALRLGERSVLVSCDALDCGEAGTHLHGIDGSELAERLAVVERLEAALPDELGTLGRDVQRPRR
jgi:hypothetical protein